MNKRVKRFLVYILGLIILALGISLNTKTSFGVSPIISIPFMYSEVYIRNFTACCMILYLIIFIIEMIIKGKKRKAYDLVQLPFCFFFTLALGAFAEYLPEARSLPARIGLLILAILLTGLGAFITLEMRIVPNPADGLVQVLNDRFGLSLGLWKNIVDLTCVVITVIWGFLAAGKIVGVGIGTLAAMLLTGRAVALSSFVLKKRLDKICEEGMKPQKTAEENSENN